MQKRHSINHTENSLLLEGKVSTIKPFRLRGDEIALLAQLRQQIRELPRGLQTRFAPSPTGHLHLGHAASALFVWGIAEAIEAKVILRFEDHDRVRSRQNFVDSILEDLVWLGFINESSAYELQSHHDARYQSSADRLQELGLTYACRCSRRDIQTRTGEQSQEEICYDGACRLKAWPEQDAGLRVILDAERIAFQDLWCGHQSQQPSLQCGDLLIRDRDRNWTYNFAVTVDDAAEGIDLIIRGQDILSATGRQLQLRQLLSVPGELKFLHHPLIHEESGQKLSKRYGSTSLKSLREQGAKAEEILGQAAFAAGLLPAPQALSSRDMKGLFL